MKMNPPSPTVVLSDFISSLDLGSVPKAVRDRAKYLILDGIGCALVGARLPWSATGVRAISSMEAPGPCTVIGHTDLRLGPLPAALLNSSFIQGFELDDWHLGAPLHSNSILIPALLAAAENAVRLDSQSRISGADFLLSMLVGYEVGPRVGLALHGQHVLSMGWHSGAVFGPPASAAAVGKMLQLGTAQIEEALGIACTQACGLMSAQFESDVKRMQHGFAARNGLWAALMVQNGYKGIKRVFEREYGGFLDVFSRGNGKTPQYDVSRLTSKLGEIWEQEDIKIKAYASCAACHPTIDCVRLLQENHGPKLSAAGLADIQKIEILLGKTAFDKCGWKAQRPLGAIGAQMSNEYAAVTQLIDHAVTLRQFSSDMLDRDEVWRLVDLTTCSCPPDFGRAEQEVIVTFKDGAVIREKVARPRGFDPALTNQEVLERFREITQGVITDDRGTKIEELVLSLENIEDITALVQLIAGDTLNIIA